MPVGTVYDCTADGWEASAVPVYGPLGRLLVAHCPFALGASLVLDAGCGTGAAARAALALGARVVGADSSVPMAQQGKWTGLPTAAGDVLALPFADGVFDVAMAGFVINHVPPSSGFAELARVVRPGGAVLASTWERGTPDPVKSAIEDVLQQYGWTAPEWWREMSTSVELIAGTPARLSDEASHAGLADVRVDAVHADLGIQDAASVIAYRLSLPHIALWFATLDADVQRALVHDAERAAQPLIALWRPAVLLLSARV